MSTDFNVVGTLFSQTPTKQKWKNTKYCLNQRASCFDISPDGSSFLIGEVNGQLVTLCISCVISLMFTSYDILLDLSVI
ncbi:hypothetical protein LOAG_17961 [Loa loa]|uniref:Uncharacterized protein n=1 Tax=Loa loa TaxID=7209 RepID=A0A1S0UHC3_LOALO|nr:hypothetical protein LOAG_17961 [Loa loa]EJD74768.1 hypothetical protein LOAG_17961 [Loa loa]